MQARHTSRRRQPRGLSSSNVRVSAIVPPVRILGSISKLIVLKTCFSTPPDGILTRPRRNSNEHLKFLMSGCSLRSVAGNQRSRDERGSFSGVPPGTSSLPWTPIHCLDPVYALRWADTGSRNLPLVLVVSSPSAFGYPSCFREELNRSESDQVMMLPKSVGAVDYFHEVPESNTAHPRLKVRSLSSAMISGSHRYFPSRISEFACFPGQASLRTWCC